MERTNIEKLRVSLPELMHIWYLMIIEQLNPESYNKNAQKTFNELSEEQKKIDYFIADRTFNKLCKAIWKDVKALPKTQTFGEYWIKRKAVEQLLKGEK